MKTLHQNNTELGGYGTLCGLRLSEDVRRRDDVLLATLKLNKEDRVSNFGEDAEICSQCQEKVGLLPAPVADDFLEDLEDEMTDPIEQYFTNSLQEYLC